MDRMIALLAALVGLIALGGAIVVQTSGEAQRQQLAADMVQLKLQVGLMSPSSPAEVAAATRLEPEAPQPDTRTAEAIAALESRIAVLERTTRDQAYELETARAALAAMPKTQAAPQVATAGESAPVPTASAAPAAIVADGPTTDCIPLGTRFMASAGDSFPICKTKAVVRVADVSEGMATLTGPGAVAAGAFANLEVQGCTVMVFSADSSGYAEMRVTCQ